MGRRWLLLIVGVVCTIVLMAMVLRAISRETAFLLIIVNFILALPFAVAWQDK